MRDFGHDAGTLRGGPCRSASLHAQVPFHFAHGIPKTLVGILEAHAVQHEANGGGVQALQAACGRAKLCARSYSRLDYEDGAIGAPRHVLGLR
jgi:hypothetical protein